MTSRLSRAYQQRHRNVHRVAAQQITGLYGAVDAATFVTLAVAVDQAATAAAVSLADSYMATYLTVAVGEPVAGLGVDPATVGRPIPGEQLWERPGAHARRTAAAGGNGAAAGLAYARQAIRANVQMAARDIWHQWTTTDPRVVGYRRVLNSATPCGLCIVASTQRYHRDNLLPIHSNCACTVEPLVGAAAPGRVLDADRLAYVADNADGTTRKAVSRYRADVGDLPPVQVRHHGELGPTLTDARHRFTGPEDLAA